MVTLECEDDNPHDNFAVAVRLHDHRIGYLMRRDTEAYRRKLDRKGLGTRATVCDAIIIGGSFDKPSLGVWLDIDVS
ncbi:HIRAN domain-containing protein [Bordetella sp. LUAb4]|uniref:HIRAN domain-containing protein n=1 Tax=Bordetella sp. LUAb4 TaxID=2843195 RepID=UPI001E4A249B|nr:HIRAN domain-containing protein [Bordetella sp. LUAb4]